MMHKCIIVKIGEAKRCKLSSKDVNFIKIGGKFINVAEIGWKFINFLGKGGKKQYASLAWGMDTPRPIKLTDLSYCNIF